MASPASGANERPWEGYDRVDGAIGAGFELLPEDLDFILAQIKISEEHARRTVNPNPGEENPDPVGDPNYCSALIGNSPNQIPSGQGAEELPFGVRVLDGTCNNLVTQSRYAWGAADQEFIRLTPAGFREAEEGTTYNGDNAGGMPPGFVIDSEPRVTSNLIVDQTAANPAAVEAGGPGADISPDGDVEIPNVAPDEGLSAPYNDMFTFFGQFFDHGLDFKSTNGQSAFVPLQEDDPLFVPGSPLNFMILSRTTNPGQESLNRTTPYVDQNQTFASHPSHQVFLRHYSFDGAGLNPVSTGQLIEGVAGGMANWDDVQAQAALLGINLTDDDVERVPLLATDQYGRFLPGPARGMPQVVTAGGLVEGDPANLVDASTGVATGHNFLIDIAHHAVPGTFDPDGPTGPLLPVPKTPDTDPGTGDDGDPATYDDEMLGAHFMAGDGRVNENIALTSVHHVFHSEHNRLSSTDTVAQGGHVDSIVNTLLAKDPAAISQWELSPGVWNGEYLFQAAKFITEMEYQHLAFEEFARKVQPQVNVFAGYDTTINAAISAEFAHSTYRFGHSMLNSQVVRFDENGNPNSLGLIDAFLNPPAFLDAGGANYTPEQAAGAVFRGGTSQVGQEIDEFVVEALRNNLVGLPLDLATINMARGREAGILSLNETRRSLFAIAGDGSLAPYDSWEDFSFNISHADSLVNFVAAYGTHPTIENATTVADKRAAAELILGGPAPGRPGDADDFIAGLNAWATASGAPTTTGVDDIDLWVGGLAETTDPFGGLLGTTHNYVFELQMENLQNGDRFYYLHRLAGVNLLASLEGNSFAELIERNTDVTTLPADVFSRPDYRFDVEFQNAQNPNGITDDPATAYLEPSLLTRTNGFVRFNGGEHTNMWGGAGADRIWAGIGDDTVRGNDGNDILRGGSGNDAVIGGNGDDIITDSFGDDGLKGGPGNDAINGGPGFDLLQGGSGSDFIIQGSDPSETFGGAGNDFIYGGASFATLFGDYGDDWIEGGGQADLVQGDNGNPFQNDPNGGHDVLDGGPGADDYDSEGGDDILIASPGTSRFEGMLGFDFVTFRNYEGNVDADMDFNQLVPDTIDPLRDRYDLVEAVSGWTGDDVIRGDSFNALLDGPGNEVTQGTLDRTAGLSALVGPGFNTGNILLGGGGSDLIEGRGENDVIDGDRWLNVQLEANGTRYDSILQLQAQVFNGSLNPGDISIVREILIDPSGTDTAYFEGLFTEYDFNLTNGVLTVDHARGCGDETGGDVCNDVEPGVPGIDTGVDTLRNIEVLQFLDFTVTLESLTCDAFLATVVLGLGATHPQFGLTPTIGNDIIAGTSASDTINDLGGSDIICGKGGNDTIDASDGNDIVFGGPGNDNITGGNGGDQLIGEAGNDTIDGGNEADYINGGDGDDIITGGDNPANTIDILEGGAGNDNINGGTGDDYVLGHDGDDTLIGGEGADYLWGGLGIDTFEGNDGRDYLDGGDEDETMNGGLGDDIILGHGGADTLIGGPAVGDGSDYIWGGAGIDSFEGGDGPDYLDGNSTTVDGEVMNGGAGDDNVLGFGGDDTLDGGDGDDYVWGSIGADTLSGGDGAGDVCQDPDGGVFDLSCEFEISA